MTLTLAVGQRVRLRAGDHADWTAQVIGFRDRAGDFEGDPVTTSVAVHVEGLGVTGWVAPRDLEPIGDGEETG